jgi:translation initiation factor eIF-2B subunit epsilon
VLLPLVNVPTIDYRLSWLEISGVEEVFVLCARAVGQGAPRRCRVDWEARRPRDGRQNRQSRTMPSPISPGDPLQVMYGCGVMSFSVLKDCDLY